MHYKSAKIQKRYSFSCTFSLFLIKKTLPLQQICLSIEKKAIHAQL